MLKNLIATATCLVVFGLLAACSPKEAPSSTPSAPAVPARVIRGIVPISNDEAVIFSDSGPEHHFDERFELVRANGQQMWLVRIPNFEMSPTWGSVPLTASDDHIFILGRNKEYETIVSAVARADGREIWRHTLPQGSKARYQAVSLLSDGERLIVVYYNYRESEELSTDANMYVERILALKSTTGERLWPEGETTTYIGRAPLDVALAGPGRLIARRTFISDEDSFKDAAFVIDTATGETIQTLPDIFQVAKTPAGFLVDAIDIMLYPGTPQGLGEGRVLVSSSPQERFMYGWPLGIYKDLAILAFEPNDNDDSSWSVKGVELATGHTRWTYNVQQQTYSTPDILIDGVFPKMLPIVTSTRDRRYWLTLLNLETGLAGPSEARETPSFFITPTRSVVYESTRGTLFDYDGETGKSTHAPYLVGKMPPFQSAHDLRFDRLWYYPTDAEPATTLAWTVIDIPTWKVFHENGK